jgi:hypothetical protein
MVWGNYEGFLHDGVKLCEDAFTCTVMINLPCHVEEFPCHDLYELMQAASVTAGATGIWQRIGSGWHVASLPSSLKKVFPETVAVNKESVATGAVNLPLRLGFIGHEGCTHTTKDFQRMRADMRDCVSQVGESTFAHMHIPCHA